MPHKIDTTTASNLIKAYEQYSDISEIKDAMARIIAEELSARARYIAEQATQQKEFEIEGALNNFTCPICKNYSIQELRKRKWFHRGIGECYGFACQTEYCPVRGLIIPLELVNTYYEELQEEKLQGED